jgi:hypothetical protein
MMSMSSHAGDDATEIPSHTGDGVAESCWRWHCQGDLVTM